jgi:hypothetical protein
MSFRPAVHVPLSFGVASAVFLVPGLLLSFSHASADAAARGSSLVSVTAATLRTWSVGEVVLVEGKLAMGNRAGFREFVAYHRDRFAGVETSGVAKDQEKWTSIETVTPPLVIDSADGAVAVINSAYEMRNAPQQWRDVDPSSNVLGRDGERAYGFIAGDAVTVEGRVVAAPGARGAAGHDRALEALVLTAGDRAAYLDFLRGGAVATRLIGAIFTGLGVVLALLAIWLRARFSRKPVSGVPIHVRRES